MTPVCRTTSPPSGAMRAVEQLHERALPGAVAAEEADALPALDREACAVEDRRSAERDADVLHAEQRHSHKLTNGPEAPF